ncbi:hypothetical protein GCM10008935_09010 [Alkalibacillus silvisoli]|uniref:Spore photoproduct lyase n=1 Tax=Alkalibacillus silvisoli TaxID=392823 RepID=A0ABP3JK53_9BACI
MYVEPKVLEYPLGKQLIDTIQQNYLMTKLELDEAKRKKKFGKYGISKYVYQDEEQEEMKNMMQEYLKRHFPTAKFEYFT